MAEIAQVTTEAVTREAEPRASSSGEHVAQPAIGPRPRLPLEREPSEKRRGSVRAGVTVDPVAHLAARCDALAADVLFAAWVAVLARVTGESAFLVRVWKPGGPEGGVPAAVGVDDREAFGPHLERARALVEAAARRAESIVDEAAEGLGFDASDGAGASRARCVAWLEVETGGAASVVLDAARFDQTDASRLAAAVSALLEDAARTPAATVAELALVDPAERARILSEQGPSATFEPTSFHALFERQASATPDRPALACEGTRYTYAELDERANRLAHALVARGVGPNRCVALLVERNADMIVGLLGVAKAGGAYVPLAADAPRARLAHQITETRAPVILTHARLAASLPETSASVLCLDRDWPEIAKCPGDRPSPRGSASDLAYVIYTSGSTGTPKGVLVTHDNLVNYTRAICTRMGLSIGTSDGPALSFATVSTLAADLGNTCIFPSLLSGGCLHVIPHEMAMDGDAFGRYAARVGIDVLKITPSHLAALLAFGDGKGVLPRRYLVTGGEASTWRLVETVRAASDVTWINHYGPTETTVGSLTFDLDRAADVRPFSATVPIGRPIANTRAYVLDARRALVPTGVVGELWIGGRGVTRGYLEQPVLTSERFVPDPFADEPDARMYRTGDRVRRLPDGSIEFVGRVDHQVKIRGFRIELGEIEAVLRRDPRVREAVVIAAGDDPSDRRIVAYVVFVHEPGPGAAELREILARDLPPYMIPSAFVSMEALPLTPNGKVDRRALPAPRSPSASVDATEREGSAGATADDEIEQRLAAIWREVLGISAVARNADFFEIGGHSLAALHVIARIERELGKKLGHGDLIQHPTIAGLASAIRAGTVTRDFASLVPLQPHGTRPPLFCVHGGGGHVYYYRDLARRLGPDQPFYALQGRHVDGKLPRQTRVEDMAEFYLSEVREVAPRGPYYLCGASFGGKVAFEMAQILRRRGEVVALVAMFDTWGPGYPRYREGVGPIRRGAYWLYRRIEHHVGSLWHLEPDRRWPYLREKAMKARTEIEDHLRLFASRRLGLRDFAAADGAQHVIDEGFIHIASRAYQPTFYPGKVILFRSKQQPLGIYEDPTLGWGSLCQELEIHDVVGLHAAVVAEPRVGYLVERFAPCLAKAQAEFG